MELDAPQQRKRGYGARLKALAPLMAAKLKRPPRIYDNGRASDNGGNPLVASYNIHKCIGRDGRFNPARTMAVIKDIGADIIALQEVDERFGDRTGLLDLHALERDCGLVAVDLKRTRSSHGWRGNLLLARGALVDGVQQLRLPGAEPRGALVVDLTLASGPVRVIAAHLGLLRRSRAAQIRALLGEAEAADGRPSVLMGDLNEWRIGKGSSLHALEPTFGPLDGAIASFPSRLPLLSLDRILASPHGLISRIELHDTPLSRIASDHLPIKAVVELAQSSGATRQPRAAGSSAGRVA